MERHCTQIFTRIKRKGKVYAIIHALAIQASQGLFMSHPFPPHECGGEGVGLAKGRGGVKPPPEQSLRRLLLVELNESRLEETSGPTITNLRPPRLATVGTLRGPLCEPPPPPENAQTRRQLQPASN